MQIVGIMSAVNALKILAFAFLTSKGSGSFFPEMSVLSRAWLNGCHGNDLSGRAPQGILSTVVICSFCIDIL